MADEVELKPRPSSIPAGAVEGLVAGLAKLPYVLSQLGFTALREGQDRAVRTIMSGRDSVVILPTGTGKCFAPGTKLRLFAGGVVSVEGIRPGDILMGPDSGPRTVVSTTAGRGPMFEIKPSAGDSHFVNGDHMLTLVVTPAGVKGTSKDNLLHDGKRYGGGDLLDVTVMDYLQKNRTFKHRTKLVRVGVEFQVASASLPLDPYILGLWLGDGTLGVPHVTKPDRAVTDALTVYAEEVGAKITKSGAKCLHSITFPHDKRGRRGGANVFINQLRDAGVYERKHIPASYKTATRHERAELLAGLLDTDGYLSNGSFEVTFKQKELADDTVELAWSLGLHAVVGEKWAQLKSWDEPRLYHRVHIAGATHTVPTRIPRRKSADVPKQRNSLRRSFSVIPRGEGDYFGFAVEGADHRVLLWDYTVTHNSLCFVVPTLCMGWRTIVIYPLISLMRDQATSMQKKGLSAATISSNETDAHNAAAIRDWATGSLQFMLVSPERFSNAEWASVVEQFPPDFIAMDEMHTFADWADTFRPGYKFAGEFIRRTKPKVVAGFSATLSEEAEVEARAGLGIQGAKLVYHYPRRTNLHPQTLFLDNIKDAAPWVSQNCHGPTIVYSSTRKRVEEYAELIGKFTNRPVYFYHGGMKPADKKYQQDRFMRDSDPIIVATNAFGMGIDKVDVRNVVHFDIPGTLVALAQEMGRAGRDQEDSWCTIIPTPDGIRTRRHFIRCGNPTEQDIRRFVRAAASMRTGHNGVVTAKREEIARRANVDLFSVQSIMAFCLGENILVHDDAAAKQHRLKFLPDIPSWSKVEAECRTAVWAVGVDKEKDGWLHVDINALAEQMDRDPATVMSRLKKMHDSGKIEWVRSSTSKPLRLGLDLDAVDPAAYARLNLKAKEAEADLQRVLDYCDLPDEDKHDFLEKHLNRP